MQRHRNSQGIGGQEIREKQKAAWTACLRADRPHCPAFQRETSQDQISRSILNAASP